MRNEKKINPKGLHVHHPQTIWGQNQRTHPAPLPHRGKMWVAPGGVQRNPG